MIACVDGKVDPVTAVPLTGCTLPQLADLLVFYGAASAGESGGGGDTGLWIKDKLVTGFSDPTERPTVQQILIYTEGDSTMAKNKVTITWADGARERKSPSTFETVVGNVLPKDSVWYSDYDIVADKEEPYNPDKKWIMLTTGWYVAVRYPSTSGIIERARVEPIAPAPEPEPSPTHVVEVTIDGMVVFRQELL